MKTIKHKNTEIRLISKPLWFNAIPWLSDKYAQGFAGSIFLPKRIFDSLTSENPDPYYQALIAHESTHIKRQRSQGTVKWLVEYMFNRKFRVNEEIAADQEMLKVMRKHKIKFDIDKRAKALSSWVYFWPISFEEARKRLREI